MMQLVQTKEQRLKEYEDSVTRLTIAMREIDCARE